MGDFNLLEILALPLGGRKLPFAKAHFGFRAEQVTWKWDFSGPEVVF